MLFKASAVFLEVRGEFAFYSPNRSSLKTTSIIFHMQLVFIRKPWLQAFRGLFFFFLSLSLSSYHPFWTSRNEGEPANLPMFHL